MIFTGSALVYGIGVVAVALGLTGCADSDLENANLRIENTKMCMEIAEGHRQYYFGAEARINTVYNEKEKACYVLKTAFIDRQAIYTIINVLTGETVFYYDQEYNKEMSHVEAQEKIVEFGFENYKR